MRTLSEIAASYIPDPSTVDPERTMKPSGLYRSAIESGTSLSLLRLLAEFYEADITPTLPPIFDRQRMRCIRRGLARSVVTGTEITAAGRAALAIESQIKAISDMSDSAWEQAADQPRDDSTDARFLADWDACLERYVEARQAVDRGDLAEARDVLRLAAILEGRWGSSEHALKAIALLS